MENNSFYDERLLIKAAWYYYIEGYTQQKIGEYLGISRLSVNRLLDRARKTGVVHFTIRDVESGPIYMENELINRFNLKDAFVVPSPKNEEDVNETLAQAAAMYIHERLGKSTYINMGYGDTSSRILNHLANICEFPLNIVSLTGGVNYYLPNARSSVFNARLFLMPSPLLMNDDNIVKSMAQEPSIRQINEMKALSDMSVMSIGAMDENATLIANGLLTPDNFLLLSMKGAVGDILCHFIDINGNLIYTEFEDRLISTSLDRLKSMKNTIGVAGGKVKSEAILGALRGGYLDILIIDEVTALDILKKNETL